MRIILLIMLVTAAGCSTMDRSKFVSPSESLYYKANTDYDNKDYAAAIEKYEAFLEAMPRSALAPAASLNIGMSHYYQENYKDAYYALKDLTVKDESIKAFVDGIIETSKTKAKSEIEAEEKAKAEAAAAAETAATGEMEIAVLDAYLDNFGSVALQGSVGQKATVIIDNKKINTNDSGNFNATAKWKKGEPIIIAAQTADGQSGEINYYPDGEAPEKPTGLRTINITGNSMEIEWDENPEDDIKGYRLFYRRQGGALHEVPELVTGTKHEVVGLAGESNTIEFYLRAVDKMDNESEDSDILEADLL